TSNPRSPFFLAGAAAPLNASHSLDWSSSVVAGCGPPKRVRPQTPTPPPPTPTMPIPPSKSVAGAATVAFGGGGPEPSPVETQEMLQRPPPGATNVVFVGG